MTLPLLRIGSSGAAVIFLQTQLNLASPEATLLAVDGQFGPRTQARVIEFQKARKLSPDGVVGPITWGALTTIEHLPPSQLRFTCDNGNPANQAFASRLAAGLARPNGNMMALRDGSGGSGGSSASPLAISIGGYSVLPLKGSKYEATATSVYGSSLDLDRIFYSTATGAQGRAFTAAVPIPLGVTIPGLPLTGYIQIINIGSSPTTDTVIHELGHVWQSQHHATPLQFIANCLACQAKAVALNAAVALFDSTVKSHAGYPENYPYSAYAYERGNSFGDYGGEQIAQQIEKNEAAIRTKVKGVSAGAADSDNTTSLKVSNVKVCDRRLPTVHI